VTDERLDEFIEYLRRDGLFTLRLMGHNVNTIVVSEIVCHMWKNFFSSDLAEDIEENSQHSDSTSDAGNTAVKDTHSGDKVKDKA
jgi:hypothetical protein